MGIIGAIGIVVALLLTIQSNRIARDTAQRQLRAYVVMRDLVVLANLSNEEKKLEGITLRIRLENVGVTPATVRDAFINLVEAAPDDPLPDGNITLDPMRKVAVTIGSGQPELFGARNVTRDQLDRVGREQVRLYAFSVIRYTDVFARKFETISAAEIVVLIPPSDLEARGLEWRNELPKSPFRFETVPNFGYAT